MSFEQLVHVAKLNHAEFPHNLLIFKWQEKREHLAVYMEDLPKLVEEYKKTKKEPYEHNPRITLIDPFPKIRLASTCEAVTNCLYGMAEIAARFANKVSKEQIPSSFNDFRKKVERGKLKDTNLSKWINDFSWYKKVREIRTEWAHFSTIFIGEDNDGNPIIVLNSHRHLSDKEEFPNEVQIQITDLIDWINQSITLIDRLGDYLLIYHMIPKLDPTAKFTIPKYDEAGWPMIKDNHTMEVEKITISDYLKRGGINLK